MDSENPPPVPLPEVFSCLGAELRDLARRLERVEAAMSKLLDASSRVSADTAHELVTDLQALDLIQQSLVSLGEFSDGLSRAATSHAAIDVAAAARGICLSELATRLGGRRDTAAAGQVSGDAEFF